MKISIIIPTINEAKNIGLLLRYLQENDLESVAEIIVVDGGSADATKSIAEAEGATVISCQVCSRAIQMNAGAAASSADILYFVHADTFPPATFAADILAEISAGVKMGCFRYQFDSSRKILKFNAWFVRFKWMWCQGGDKTFFIRKDVFAALGGYNEHFVVMEEYDFLRRAMKKHALRIVPKNVIVSARKYERNSWLRVQIANLVAFNMFRMGIDSRRIRDTYKGILR